MTAALILAAGSEATGQDNKLLFDIGGVSPIRRLIMLFSQSGVQRIVVVTGYDAEKLERHCAHMGAVFLQNKDFESDDILGSARLGLQYLKGKCSRAFVSHAGVALFSSETAARLLETDADIAVPTFEGRQGHPLLLSEELFDSIIAYEGEDGLEGAIASCGAECGVVEVPDRGVLLDVREDADYGDIVSNHELRRIRPGFKLWLSGEKGFFGPGALQLLTLAEETGSLKLACRQMGVSYSKAWKVIADIESQLGYSVVLRRQGGKDGGGIELTENGRELIVRFEAFERESREQVRQIFARHFGSHSDSAV